jgi:hypothetical protein
MALRVFIFFFIGKVGDVQAVVGAADQKKIRKGCLKNGIIQIMDFFGTKSEKHFSG